MLKYTDTQIVFREFPGEITLAINISGCPNHCPGCHSPELQQDIGKELNWDILKELIDKNPGITCVGFMGGDNDPTTVLYLAHMVRAWTNLKTGWYTGGMGHARTMRGMDFVKIGLYKEEFGPLDELTTNQVYLERQPNGDWRDRTDKFWVHKSPPENP